jgi:hypothetical protein
MSTGANRQGDERHVPKHRMRGWLGSVRGRKRMGAKGNGGRRVSRQNANASGLVTLRL